MKKLRIMIIGILCIITIIVASLLLLLSTKSNHSDSEIQSKDFEEGDVEIKDTTNIEKVSTISKFKTVENCIQMYYDILNKNSDIYYNRNNEKIVSNEEINNCILDLLSEEYIQTNNINTNNIENSISKIEEKLYVVAIDMGTIRMGNIEKYICYGILINSEYKLIDDIYVYVTLDIMNSTYSIEPISKEIYLAQQIEIKNESINKNNYNEYNEMTLGNEDTVKEFADKFKKLSIADPQYTYNMLFNEYRTKKFEQLENYQEYIQNNFKRIAKMNITKYRVSYEEDYIEYVCIDQNDFYYIFRQQKNDPLNYSIILDTYTLESADFTKKYDEGDVKQKVGMNVEKVISAINCNDYEYIYSKLDETFKKNNYLSTDILKKTLKDNLFDINKVTYKTFDEIGDGIYSLNVIVYSYENEKDNKNMTIITDSFFPISISFSFE